MGARAVFWAVGLSLLVAGCSVIGPGIDTLAYRIKSSINDCEEKARNRRWAEAAWERIAKSSPTPFSGDYGKGFRDGFSGYLYTGWPDVPPLPPRHYRDVKYQTSAGYRAIEDWFAGYRLGVSVAQQEGYRDWITGPSSLRPPGSPGGPGCPPPELAKATQASPAPVKAPETSVVCRPPCQNLAQSAAQPAPPPVAPVVRRLPPPPPAQNAGLPAQPPVPPVVRLQLRPTQNAAQVQPPPATTPAQQGAADGRRGLIIRLGFNWPW